MELTTNDYLKKSLLDTQERVRDFMDFSSKANDADLSKFFKKYAETEAKQARQMQKFIEDMVQ